MTLRLLRVAAGQAATQLEVVLGLEWEKLDDDEAMRMVVSG